MSNLNQFIGESACTSIVNTGETPPTIGPVGIYVQSGGSTVGSLSGALTANTLATALSITGGGGYIEKLAIMAGDATSRTLRIKITLDGVVVYDKTSAAIAGNAYGILAIGGLTYVPNGQWALNTPQPRRFNTSCLVEIASSLTETDKATVYYAYSLT